MFLDVRVLMSLMCEVWSIRISTPLVALVPSRPHLHQQLRTKSEISLKWVMVVGMGGTGGGAAARTVCQYGVNTTDGVYGYGAETAYTLVCQYSFVYVVSVVVLRIAPLKRLCIANVRSSILTKSTPYPTQI